MLAVIHVSDCFSFLYKDKIFSGIEKIVPLRNVNVVCVVDMKAKQALCSLCQNLLGWVTSNELGLGKYP